jgi:hypothetical protein
MRYSINLRKILIFCALSVFLLACGFPSEEQVKNDFRAEYPTYELLSAIVGEGDGDAAYYHIRYKKPNDDQTYEQIWLYLRQKDEKIKLTYKGRETVIK